MSEIPIPQSIVDKVHAEMAKEAGMTLEEFRAALKRDAEENWCHCEGETDAIYHADGCTPWPSCTTKHHWHCGNCQKLVQIG